VYGVTGPLRSQLGHKLTNPFFLKWNNPPSPTISAYQVIALSQVFSSEAGECTPSFRQTLASVVPKIYSLLGENEDEEVHAEVQQILHKQNWIFVGDAFVASDRVAFKAPSYSRPHLFQVPAELLCFDELLKAFGVRERFSANDYAVVLKELYEGGEGIKLVGDDLELAIGFSKMLAQMSEEERKDVDKDSLYLPSDGSVMKKVGDMVYDDAPWLSASLAGRMKLRFVHPSISVTDASALGARSLREVLLSNQSGMQTIPCPSAASLHQLLEQRGKRVVDDSKVLLDLLEFGESNGVKKVSLMADFRVHKKESLLHPGLGECQGTSLVVFFHDVVLNVDELVKR